MKTERNTLELVLRTAAAAAAAAKLLQRFDYYYNSNEQEKSRCYGKKGGGGGKNDSVDQRPVIIYRLFFTYKRGRAVWLQFEKNKNTSLLSATRTYCYCKKSR